MQLADAISGFLTSMAADGYSQNTIIDYRKNLAKLGTFLEQRHRALEQVTLADLREFMSYLRTAYVPKRFNGDTSPMSEHTLANVWCSLRSFFRWCLNERLIEARPDLGLKQPKAQRPVIQPFSQEEIQRLLEVVTYTRSADTAKRKAFKMRRPTANRDRALILLLLDTGLRVSEVGRLTVGDVNLETGEIYVCPHGSGQKTKSRHVYLGRAARKALWRYLVDRRQEDTTHADDPLFLSERGQPMNNNSIRLLLAHTGRRAGVAHVYPHRFRHTFAILFLRNGGDVFSLQRALGHSTLDMVRTYLALTDADVAAAHRQASPVDRWRL